MKRRVETITIEGRTLEYAVTGKGTPILVMHGGHSNCYEEFGYTALIEQGIPSLRLQGPATDERQKRLEKALPTPAVLCEYIRSFTNRTRPCDCHLSRRAERHMLCLTLSGKSKYIDLAIRGHQRMAHPKRY